jgi:hypothetical protein
MPQDPFSMMVEGGSDYDASYPFTQLVGYSNPCGMHPQSGLKNLKN